MEFCVLVYIYLLCDHVFISFICLFSGTIINLLEPLDLTWTKPGPRVLSIELCLNGAIEIDLPCPTVIFKGFIEVKV